MVRHPGPRPLPRGLAPGVLANEEAPAKSQPLIGCASPRPAWIGWLALVTASCGPARFGFSKGSFLFALSRTSSRQPC